MRTRQELIAELEANGYEPLDGNIDDPDPTIWWRPGRAVKVENYRDGTPVIWEMATLEEVVKTYIDLRRPTSLVKESYSQYEGGSA